MDLQELGLSLSPLERKVLSYVEKEMSIVSLGDKSGLQDVEVRRALLWLSNRNILSMESTQRRIRCSENPCSFAIIPFSRIVSSLR